MDKTKTEMDNLQKSCDERIQKENEQRIQTEIVHSETVRALNDENANQKQQITVLEQSWCEVFDRNGLEFNSMDDVDAVMKDSLKYRTLLNDKEAVVMVITSICTAVVMLLIFWMVLRCRKKTEKIQKHEAVISTMKTTSLQNVSVVLQRSNIRKKDRNFRNLPVSLSISNPKLKTVAEPVWGKVEGLADVVMNANAANDALMEDIMEDMDNQGEGTETTGYDAEQ